MASVCGEALAVGVAVGLRQGALALTPAAAAAGFAVSRPSNHLQAVRYFSGFVAQLGLVLVAAAAILLVA